MLALLRVESRRACRRNWAKGDYTLSSVEGGGLGLGGSAGNFIWMASQSNS